MRINVTAYDIRLGRRNDICRCPVARAIARKLHRTVDSGEVTVTGAMVMIAPKGRPQPITPSTLIHLPEVVTNWILTYDRVHLPVRQPISFELDYDAG